MRFEPHRIQDLGVLMRSQAAGRPVQLPARVQESRWFIDTAAIGVDVLIGLYRAECVEQLADQHLFDGR